MCRCHGFNFVHHSVTIENVLEGPPECVQTFAEQAIGTQNQMVFAAYGSENNNLQTKAFSWHTTSDQEIG